MTSIMKIVKLTLLARDGSQHYVDGEDDVRNCLKTLPPKVHWRHTANIETLRNKYFTMLTQLAKFSGYRSKADYHEAIKPLLFGKFNDFEHYFISGKNTGSTRNLTYEGWVAIIEQLEETASCLGYSFK